MRVIASAVKKNAKRFWSYVKSKTTTRESVSSLVKPDGSKPESDLEKDEILQTFFSSVFTQEDMENMPLLSQVDFDSPLNDIKFTSEDVYELLSKLKPTKSPGPDWLHPRLLKELAQALSYPIALLFQKSLDSGQLPLDQKSANVPPIFKKGIKCESKNYRPVSLTCIVCKMLENLVCKHSLNHLSRNYMLSLRQHGFVHGRSCATNLLEVLDDWTGILDEGGTVDAIYTILDSVPHQCLLRKLEVDAIYLDFMKAFDSVPHQCLLRKLESYGIHGKIIMWLKGFLLVGVSV